MAIHDLQYTTQTNQILSNTKSTQIQGELRCPGREAVPDPLLAPVVQGMLIDTPHSLVY